MTTEDYAGAPPLMVGNMAIAPEGVPEPVRRAILAANEIQSAPYQFGGGHGRSSWGLDCSGSVSYVLGKAGLLPGGPMPSRGYKKYGKSGPGKWITVYAKDGHVFMTICGMRLDTTSNGNDRAGPRWNPKPRKVGEFKARHPAGL